MQQRNKKKQEWSAEEVQLLKNLHPAHTSKKWKRISEEFRTRGFKRTEVECRQKWINFLDPTLNRRDWEEWELRRMYQIHSQTGTRWCLVQKEIGRTQNKIKNRFYGTLRNFIRFLLNYFDNTPASYNYEISKIPPKFLNDLFNSHHQCDFLEGQIKNAIVWMGYKIDKKLLLQRVRENKSLYSKLHQLIVATFESLAHSQLENSPTQSQVGDDKTAKQPTEERRHDQTPGQVQVKVQQRGEAQVLEQLDQGRWNNDGNVGQNMGMMQYPQSNFPMLYYVFTYL